MKRSPGETCLRACLVAACMLLTCGTLYPACDTECRERKYFYDWGLSTGYELGFDTCLMCTLNGCVDMGGPLPGKCTDLKTGQTFRITANMASCPNNGQMVEGTVVTGTGDFKDFKQNVWTCQPTAGQG